MQKLVIKINLNDESSLYIRNNTLNVFNYFHSEIYSFTADEKKFLSDKFLYSMKGI